MFKKLLKISLIFDKDFRIPISDNLGQNSLRHLVFISIFVESIVKIGSLLLV